MLFTTNVVKRSSSISCQSTAGGAEETEGRQIAKVSLIDTLMMMLISWPKPTHSKSMTSTCSLSSRVSSTHPSTDRGPSKSVILSLEICFGYPNHLRKSFSQFRVQGNSSEPQSHREDGEDDEEAEVAAARDKREEKRRETIVS